MKITEETTLAQLAIERAKLGLTYVSLTVPRVANAPIAVMVSVGSEHDVVGTGMTVAEALDTAFMKARDAIATSARPALSKPEA